MFGNTSASAFSMSGQGGGLGFPSQQHSMTAIAPGVVSPNASGLGAGLGTSMGGGSPIFQSPAGNKFPAGGGPIVFTPHSQASTPSNITHATPVSPYSYVGGSASSYVQSPPPMMGGGPGMYASPVYSSTMIGSSPHPHHPHPVASPISHGYGHGPPVQYSNVQPYGYGTRVMSGGYAYPHSPYQQQQHQPSPLHYSHAHSHHSPRDEIVEPMHCSPVGQALPHTVGGGLQYQQLHRNPNSPPRPQYMPAFLTGVDAVAAVQPRPRRMFDRSPSTSPPAVGASGSRSPQSKSPTTWAQQEGAQPGSGSYMNPSSDAANAGGSGGYTKRSQGQGPSRQLRFAESQNTQSSQAAEEKDKKRSGPPIRGFGSSEDIANFLNSPFLKDNNNAVPGSAIAQEAISRLRVGNTAIAESN